MKYVDWIQSEYAYGGYSMVEAYIVAARFPDEVIERKKEECIRYFTKGYRPAILCIWSSIKLIQYGYNQETKQLVFTEK